ncbi:MAG: homoserine kinase, partial [Actinomycetota bacterium]
DADLARLAIRIEGHGDNVLPALFGGLVLNSHDGWLRFEPTTLVVPLLLVAPNKFKTSDARRLLPPDIPRADAVANTAATAALVAALTGLAVPDSLLLATEDRVHEPYRLPMMPESLELHQALRGKGVATALAGAGPSLICLVKVDEMEVAQELATALAPEGWTVVAPGWDVVGAQVR